MIEVTGPLPEGNSLVTEEASGIRLQVLLKAAFPIFLMRALDKHRIDRTNSLGNVSPKLTADT
jgi:hypothetical protein